MHRNVNIQRRAHASTCPTEKTFTPMCKGHFVLPFGTPGTIAHLKSEYGFEFPHWIDYGYDNLPDVERAHLPGNNMQKRCTNITVGGNRICLQLTLCAT